MCVDSDRRSSTKMLHVSQTQVDKLVNASVQIVRGLWKFLCYIYIYIYIYCKVYCCFDTVIYIENNCKVNDIFVNKKLWYFFSARKKRTAHTSVNIDIDINVGMVNGIDTDIYIKVFTRYKFGIFKWWFRKKSNLL